MPTTSAEEEEYKAYHYLSLERFDLQKKLNNLESFVKFLEITDRSRRMREGDGFDARRRFVINLLTFRCIEKTRAELFRKRYLLRESADGSAPAKKQQMRDSDPLLLLVGKLIHRDLDAWGIMLTTNHGEQGVQIMFAKYLSQYDDKLTKGKREPSTETLSNWIKRGLGIAEEEAKRRETDAAAGRSSGPPSEVAKVWYDLMDFWNGDSEVQPSTDRYKTPPDHLKGKVELLHDENAAMPFESAEAKAKMREEAIAQNGEQRDAGRMEKGPDSISEYLHPRRMRTESEESSFGSDALLLSYCEGFAPSKMFSRGRRLNTWY